MDTRTKIGILLIVYAVQVVLSAPRLSAHEHDFFNTRRSEQKETGRILWSAVGDILESLPFLPFTVNVPDTISSIWGFFSGFLPGSSGNKRPKGNSTSTSLRVTGDDLVDYFFY